MPDGDARLWLAGHGMRHTAWPPPHPFDEMKDVILTAWETGCRPQELFQVEARHVDLGGKRWVFTLKGSKGKKKHRVVANRQRIVSF